MYVTHPNDFADATAAHSVPAVRANYPVQKQTRTLPNGKCLFREGDEAQNVYEVVSGVLRLTRVLENGRRQVIAFGFPGDIVGYPSDGRHHTECDAISTAEVIAHSSDTLQTGRGDPDLHQRLLQATLREISAMQDHFMMLGRKTAREKVASFLTNLAESVGKMIGAYRQISLPMTRSDIADFLGLTTETVSRTLSQLRAAGVIALENTRSLIILQPDTLLAYAECE